MARKHVFTVKSDSVRVQVLPEGESHWEYRVGAGAKLNLVITSASNRDSNASVHVSLVGRAATATITGILVRSGDKKVALHTMQSHEAADTTSDLLIKTILSGHAKCLYDGGIRVEKKAQKTNAYQRNENLLLSGRAYAESKPSLEILANDVRCTHGATTGPIDEDQLWYLSTRGIGAAAGEKLIVDGFIAGALSRIENQQTVKSIQQQLMRAV